MPHSFVAFIDESGDDGFVFLDPPDRASSEWFVLSAAIVRAANELSAIRHVNEAISPIETQRKSPMHFTALRHEQRIPITHRIANSAFKVITILVNKRTLGDAHGLNRGRRLYFYATRFLLERISWLARDSRIPNSGDGRTKLVFSKCKNLSYADLTSYLQLLRNGFDMQTEIHWPSIDYQTLEVRQHNELVGLKIADAVATGIRYAVELSPYGYCEDRHALTLKPVVYNRNGNYRSYGMKFFPNIPNIEPERGNRYAWIGNY